MNKPKVVALAGGVGGAKLAEGFYQIIDPKDLTIVVNTADDFHYLGMYISPDLDTVCYTLAGIANPITGWGRDEETWNVLNQLEKLGMPAWFRVGDKDFATHINRTTRLSQDWSLSKITAEFCKKWGIQAKVIPMSDYPVQTWVNTSEGVMQFQDYFVRQKCEPKIKDIIFRGSLDAKPAPGILDAIREADAIIICPSNPWVSIDPILSIPGIKSGLEGHLVIAVSPIIGGQAIKGPAAKMFSEFGIQPSALAVAQHYGNIINVIYIDTMDKVLYKEINSLEVYSVVTDILMHDRQDRGRLASEILEFIKGWEYKNQ